MRRLRGRISAAVRLRDLGAGELDRSRRRLVDARHESRERGLAAAGLADHADGFARHDVEIDAIDRLHDLRLAEQILARQRKVLDEPAHAEQRRLGRRIAAGLDSVDCRPTCTLSGKLQLRAVLGHPAACAAAGRDFVERRMLGALGDAERAARLEPASGGSVQRIGRQALDGGKLLAGAGIMVDARDRVDQRPGVGMPRIGQHLRRRPFLDDLARIHHQHALAHTRDHAERVADQDDRGADSRD